MKLNDIIRSLQVITRNDIKVAGRYCVIAFFMYLSWFILQPPFIKDIKGLGDIGIGAIYTSVLGSIAYIIKSNWSTNAA